MQKNKLIRSSGVLNMVLIISLYFFLSIIQTFKLYQSYLFLLIKQKKKKTDCDYLEFLLIEKTKNKNMKIF